MKTKKETGILLSADYENIGGNSTIQVFLRTKKGILEFIDPEFRPYFIVTANITDLEKTEKFLSSQSFGEQNSKIFGIEKTEKGSQQALKVFFRTTLDLTSARDALKENSEFRSRAKIWEYDIPFAKRYLIDKALSPMAGLEIEFEEQGEKKIIKGAKQIEHENIKLKIAAIDIETLSPGRFSDPEKDPVLMASYADEKEQLAFTTKKSLEKNKNCKIFENEKEMLKALAEFIQKKEPDILVTYNGDNFDLPYLKERCRKYKFGFDIGHENSPVIIKKKGISDRMARLKGIQHLDAFHMLRMLSRFGVVSLIKYDLESVAKALYGYEKKKIHAEEINKIWETGEGLEELVKYNIEDSYYTLKIALDYFLLLSEFCVLVKQEIFDVSRASASQLVEALLIKKAFELKKIVPNRPSEAAVSERITKMIKGAYVKEPIPGLHENIAVLDFRSLYPSIIIAHNVSPDALNCEHQSCRTGKNLNPNGDWFCEKKTGFLPIVLKEILDKRVEIKKQFRKAEKGTEEWKKLNARQQAFKILLNSSYGYLAFSRSRWYSLECGGAITAWSRHYVQDVIQKAEKAGFTVLYGDTDSNFLEIPKGKTHEDVKEFVEKINSELPEAMELELDGFYKRGIFVTRKEGTQAAKKRYALIDHDNKLKIVGFEYVRRDWAKIAKETQKQVIAEVLKEGRPEKALAVIREKIKELKEGKTPKSDLVVLTQIQRPLDKYESIGPHVAAAIKAVKKGKEITEGSVVGFIITRAGNSISDKAQLEEYVNEGNYDADYYITHQLVPAVIHIMRELGYSKEDLIQGGKQQKLFSF